MTAIINAGHESGRNYKSDTRKHRQASACVVLAAYRSDVLIEDLDPLINVAKLIEEFCKKRPPKFR
jgi:hypothetical protein